MPCHRTTSQPPHQRTWSVLVVNKKGGGRLSGLCTNTLARLSHKLPHGQSAMYPHLQHTDLQLQDTLVRCWQLRDGWDNSCMPVQTDSPVNLAFMTVDGSRGCTSAQYHKGTSLVHNCHCQFWPQC
jgi:hypothetical protein